MRRRASKSFKGANFFLAAVLCLFAAVLFFLQYHPAMVEKLQILQVDHVPSELLSYNKLGELFHRLGITKIVPNDSPRYQQRYDLSEAEYLGPFQKRRQIGGALITSGEVHPLLQAAEDNLKPTTGGNTACISVTTEPASIHGEKGILSNHQQHGKNWERLAFVAIRIGDTLLAKSAVGLRLHGGTSRDPSLEKHSYRLYFRKKYGNQWLDTEGLFPGIEALRTLVVHVDIPEGWPLNNVIANEVYAMAGVPTLEYSKAEFILNGEDSGLYWLSPHLSEKYIRSHYQLKSIHYQRYRGQEKYPVYRLDMARLESDDAKPLSYDKMSKVIDVDGMMNYFIAVTFSGNTDWNQGVGYRDAEVDSSVWRWIAWDLDHSFIDWYGSKSRNPDRKVWQQEGLGLIFDGRINRLASERRRLFRRLFAEDPDFTGMFVKRYVDVLNHELSPERLTGLYEKYRKIALEYGMDMNSDLLLFFQNRHAHIRYEMRHYFKLPEFMKLQVDGELQQEIIVDGYREKLPYTGYYPRGTEVIIKPFMEKDGTAESRWQLGEEERLAKELGITLDQSATVRLVRQ